MTSYSHETQEITRHAQRVTSESETVSAQQGIVSEGGAGDLLMYGVLCGAIAHPILSSVAGSAGGVIGGLTDLLDSAAENLTSAAALYQQQEDEHIDLSEDIVQTLGAIDRPPAH